MGPTRLRDLVLMAVVAAFLSYVVVHNLYHWFPPLTVWTGLSLALVGLVEAGWAFYVRAKINDSEIGFGGGRLHPLAVARTVVIAQASAWVGAMVFGWWVGVLAYLLPRRSEMQAAASDTPGAVVAAACALVLVAAALWLQHCCKSPPQDPADGTDTADAATE
jgi:hypothetical protein